MNTYCELSTSHKCENEAGLKHFIKHGVIQGCAGCCRFCLNKDTCEHRCAYVKDTPIEPVKEESECQTSTPAASPAKNSSAPAANADSSSVAPAVQSMTATEAVTFDFGADDQTNALLLQDR